MAERFRNAIEEAVKAGEIKEMKGFPVGCCSYASDLLQRFFVEHNIFTWYVSGEYGDASTWESHAWLETQDGIVIDITGDQYKNKELNFTEPVYVGPRDDGFHDKFKLHDKLCYSIEKDPFQSKTAYDRRYETVLKYFKK